MSMRRIGLTVVLALSLVFAPLAAEAQQPGIVPRIGILYARGPMPQDEILQDGFRDLGYVDGRNITPTIPTILAQSSSECSSLRRYAGVVLGPSSWRLSSPGRENVKPPPYASG